MAHARRINVRDVQVDGDDIVLPSGTKIVGSYNWNTTSTLQSPRIIVPGAPPIYVHPGSRGRRDTHLIAPRPRRRNFVKPVSRGFTVSKDVVSPLVDRNGMPLLPLYSVDPLFHSLAICSPAFDLKTVDIVTDRSILRKLLAFCNNRSTRTTVAKQTEYGNEPFKFFVHAIGEYRNGGRTLAFTKVATGQEVPYLGYNENFEKKLTEKDPGSPPGAKRFSVVAKMNLGGIDLLVQSAVDARETACQEARNMQDAKTATQDPRNTEDAICEKLQNTRVSHEKDSEPKVTNSTPLAQTVSSSGLGDGDKIYGISSTRSGELLPDDSQLLELKSKNQRYSHEIDWMDVYWQMVLGCTNKVMLGLHLRGTYDNVQQLPIKEVKARAERAGSSSMVYLANTLREVIKAAHCLMAAYPRSPAVVVEHSMPTTKAGNVLCVRLAVESDEAVAPTVL